MRVLEGEPTRMGAEAREASLVLRRQEDALAASDRRLGGPRCGRKPPQLVVTCARGSSAHAATFGKHLIERHLGIPVSAAAPNIASIYRQPDWRCATSCSSPSRRPAAARTSSRPPRWRKPSGAITVAIVNDAASPLARRVRHRAADAGRAGTERRGEQVVHRLARHAAAPDRGLGAATARCSRALDRLPERLDAAAELDWSAALAVLARAHSVMTIGRGPTLAIAREAALKLKETCNLHAEAFSSAEFQHGPITLVEPAYPVLLFAPADQAAAGIETLRDRSVAQGRFACSRPKTAPGRGVSSDAGAGSSGRRCDLPDPDLLSAAAACRGAPRQRRRSAASPAEGDADPMSASARFAVAADCVFDGETLPSTTPPSWSTVRGSRKSSPGRTSGVPRRCAAGRRSGSRPASSTCRSTAAATCCSTMHRPRVDRRDRGGASQVRHHRLSPDPDHRSRRRRPWRRSRRCRQAMRRSPRCSVCISRDRFSRARKPACTIRR